jgi:dTDP-glucose 4,6-dehydratase
MSDITRGNPLAPDLEHILEHTGDLWENIREARIFITGGTGFIGCWLLESFIHANEKLGLNVNAVVLTRNYEVFHKKSPHLATHPNVKFHIGDVRDFKFPKGEFSHIIHAATEASTKLNEENPLLMFDTIIQGTRRTLDFAVTCGAKKFLLTSSGAVYGKQPPNISHISEDYKGAPDPTDIAFSYGMGKRTAEHLCILYSKKHGIETKIARCFSFVGPYFPLDNHYAIGNFIRDGITGGPIIVKGDGKPYRSYLYASDLTIWLWTILFQGEVCQPYNVGSSCELTLSDLANSVANVFHPKPEIKISKPSKRKSKAERYVPSTKRANNELGVKEWVRLNETIKKTVLWYS